MNYTISDFLNDWAMESKGTQKLFNALTDASLSQTVYPGGRSIGRIATHINTSLLEMMSTAGLPVAAPDDKAPDPVTAKEIQDAYAASSALVTSLVGANWTDDQLLDELDMYGEKWPKVMILQVLIRHEIHHRAQLTILMRQAGLVVPGIYGPAKEEWSQFGMEAMK